MSESNPTSHRWPRLYAAVLGVLALEILLFTLFTKIFQ